nr:uncharacterized protein LOC127346789 [Lolium perenne]
MDAINPLLLPDETVPRGSAPPTASGSNATTAAATEGLVVDAPPDVGALGKRKRPGQHVVIVPPAAATPPALAAPPAPAKRAKWPGNKAPKPAEKKAAPKKAANKPAAAKMASLTALTAMMAKIKKQGEAASLSLKIDVMVKSKENLVMKILEAEKEMIEAKTKEKEVLPAPPS